MFPVFLWTCFVFVFLTLNSGTGSGVSGQRDGTIFYSGFDPLSSMKAKPVGVELWSEFDGPLCLRLILVGRT